MGDLMIRLCLTHARAKQMSSQQNYYSLRYIGQLCILRQTLTINFSKKIWDIYTSYKVKPHYRFI
jgi:hypothetical protein